MGPTPWTWHQPFSLGVFCLDHPKDQLVEGGDLIPQSLNSREDRAEARLENTRNQSGHALRESICCAVRQTDAHALRHPANRVGHFLSGFSPRDHVSLTRCDPDNFRRCCERWALTDSDLTVQVEPASLRRFGQTCAYYLK